MVDGEQIGDYTYIQGNKDQNRVVCIECHEYIAARDDGMRNLRYQYTCIPCARRLGILW